MQFKSQTIIIEDSWSIYKIHMKPPDDAPWCIRYNITIIHIFTKSAQHNITQCKIKFGIKKMLNKINVY